MKIPFIKVGNSEFVSFISASKTGVNANRKKPSKSSIAKERMPDEIINKNNNIGLSRAAIIRVFLLPILSEIVPEKKVPPAPAS